MIPKANPRGHSFKGVSAYLLEGDKFEPDPDRVDWSATVNLLTDDIKRAAQIMAWTDAHADDLKACAGVSTAGAKTKAGAVYHYSLSWAQGETPEQEHMRDQVAATVARLGLSEHQRFEVSHGDTEHAHVHVVVNLTHPETGKRAVLHLDKRELQAWALEYEREHGMHCLMREENAEKAQEQGQKVKNRQQKQDYSTEVTRAYHAADNGASFVNALEAEGLTLARARRGNGYVIVDEKGDVQALSRQLDIDERNKAKTAAINNKLADLQQNDIPDGDEASKRIRDLLAQSSREQQDAGQQNKLLDAADAHAQKLIAEEETKNRQQLAYEKHLEEVTARQDLETLELEEKISAELGGQYHEIENEAERMRGVVEGKSLGLRFRRLWRGKTDREILATLERDLAGLDAQKEKARADLKLVHEKERAELQDDKAYKPRQVRRTEDKSHVFGDDLRRQHAREHLNPQTRQPRSLDAAEKDEKERLDRIRFWIGEKERQQEQAAQQERDLADQRMRFESRKEDIRRQEAGEETRGLWKSGAPKEPRKEQESTPLWKSDPSWGSDSEARETPEDRDKRLKRDKGGPEHER